MASPNNGSSRGRGLRNVARGRGLTLRAFMPNAVTAMALCFGLTGVRFAIDERWEMALTAVIIAGVLDGLDGRVARLLNAQSRFGAELDSLSDVIAFGVAPSTILFLWSLDQAPRFGWTAALALALCCALRLARFNSQMDGAVNPRAAAGFLTGAPAPAAAGLAFLPMYLWLVTGEPVFRDWQLVMPWALAVAALMLSSVPTFGWAFFRPRPAWRLFALAGVALTGAALFTAPWITLIGVCVVYVGLLPLSILRYQRMRRPAAG